MCWEPSPTDCFEHRVLTYGQDDRRDLFRGLHKCQSQKSMLVSRNIQSAPIRDIFKNMFETTRMPYPCRNAGVTPDLVLSAHAHNYQRYTRSIGGKQVPYVVAGTGGMPPQKVAAATGQPVGATADVTYDSAIASYGYLFVSVSDKQLSVEFWEQGSQHTNAFNTITVDLVGWPS